MKIVFFSTQPYDRTYFDRYKPEGIEYTYHSIQLDSDSVSLVKDHDAVCIFVNDNVDANIIKQLASQKVRFIVLRCAGFNNVDLQAAKDNNLTVVRVPEYSPHAVAEHAVALILTLNRKTHKAYNRIREGNFSLDRLIGFDIYEKTIGVIGTGKIGATFCKIIKGFGTNVIAYDVIENEELKSEGVKYVPLDELLTKSDIISLHCPLLDSTKKIINADSINKMKDGVMLINTSRGGLFDTHAVIDALKKRKIGYLGMDVYEKEGKLFFYDHSEKMLDDDVFQRLVSFPNVLVTGHQAFFTEEALSQIAKVTIDNITKVERGEKCANIVEPPKK
eukprot:TRINITY_DN6019_c0_g2_i1.p1 TRINITY_DN6019_c0_g2~~TRINITY_DN6019_c0_g2_i1.p1  ORF type:complete len:333 (-),score=61.75 TRINITY_DN6019_c0_g2_i1:7-1005(-)